MPATTSPRGRTMLFFLLAGLAMSGLFLVALSHVHEDLSHSRVEALDRSIQQAVHAHGTPALTALAETLSFIGSPGVLFPAVPLAALCLCLSRLRRDASLLCIAMGGAGTLESAIKLHYRRVRPDLPWAFVHEKSFSFPSGHSVLAIVLYGMLAYLFLSHLDRVWMRVSVAGAALGLVLGIGVSRIYLGVHFPSDVAAGYFVGGFWLLAVIASDRMLRSRAPTRNGVHPDMRERRTAASGSSKQSSR